jgi:hypothetical protein
LKAIGVILLQLLQRQLFTEKELKIWETWNPVQSLLANSQLKVSEDGSLIRPVSTLPHQESDRHHHHNNNSNTKADDNVSLTGDISLLSTSDISGKKVIPCFSSFYFIYFIYFFQRLILG